MLKDKKLKKISEIELKNLVINCYSCIRENRKKINYMSYIKDMKNYECKEAMNRIFDNIKIDDINNFIENIEIISNKKKNFYQRIYNIDMI